MAKYYGIIGYATNTVETEPGVWDDEIDEKEVVGDILGNSRSLENSGDINDNINIANKISIVADPYAMSNFHSIRYAEFMGTKWKVSNVEVQYPRLILILGGVYNNG